MTIKLLLSQHRSHHRWFRQIEASDMSLTDTCNNVLIDKTLRFEPVTPTHIQPFHLILQGSCMCLSFTCRCLCPCCACHTLTGHLRILLLAVHSRCFQIEVRQPLWPGRGQQYNEAVIYLTWYNQHLLQFRWVPGLTKLSLFSCRYRPFLCTRSFYQLKILGLNTISGLLFPSVSCVSFLPPALSCSRMFWIWTAQHLTWILFSYSK